MFGKILRAGKGGYGVKYKIDLQVVQLENLPTSIRKCRVVWARSAKLQMTDIKDARGSVASFKQTLTQVTTIYRDKAGKYEPKEYELKVQVPGKGSTESPVTVGKAVLDMAKYCKDETTTQSAMVPIAFKIGASITGYLKLSITTIFIGDSNEDGGTDVSGLTGLTSDHGSMREQDLEGFGDEEHVKFSKKARGRKREEASTSATGSSGRSSGNNKAEGPWRHKPLPPTAEEDDSDLEDKQEAEPALTTVKSSRRNPSAPRAPEIEEAEEPNDNPFAKKVSKPTVRKVPAKVWEDDEDVSPLNSDVSDSEPPKPTARPKKVEEPAQSLDELKASLFSTKKTAGSAVTGVTGASPAAAVSSSKGGSSKASKIPPPPLPIEDEDDESQRDDLFSAKPKGGLVAASNKMKAAAATAIPANAATTNAAAATAAASKQPKTRVATPPPPEDDDDEDEDLPPPSTAAQYIGPTQKPRSKAVESSEAAVAKGSSSLTRAGSKQDPSKGGSGSELEQLRKQVAQLEKQLLDEQVAKDDLNKKMQKYADKIADLEDQLAEGALMELYAQMKEMEEKHQAQIKDMEAKYQTEIKELMERHLTEVAELDEQHQAEVTQLQLAASESGRRRGGPSVEEIERLKAELAEQDALFETRAKKLAAEQAAANAAREVAETKLAAANKMIDDSLLAATKHQQENKALREEVARLKRQVEDISMWDTGVAAAAATAAVNNGRRDSAAEVELEELRERVEELEEENTRLQKLNEVAQGTAASMLSDIRAVHPDAQGGRDFWSRTDSAFGKLVIEVRCLCDAYTHQSSELRSVQERLTELSQQAAAASTRTSASGELGAFDGGFAVSGLNTSGKVKPHELLSRVQQLTAERDSLQDKLANQRQAQSDLVTAQARLTAIQADFAATQNELATAQANLAATQADLEAAESDLVAARKLVEELRQQVDTLTFEKEAVERFKVATIADLRRQNDELRSSLRSLSSLGPSPRIEGEEDLLPAATPHTAPELRAAFATLATSRAASAAGDSVIEGNWHEFEYLVAQLKADRTDLRRQVEQLKADKAVLGKQVEDLRSAGGALQVPAATASVVDMPGLPRQPSRRHAEDLELECSNLRSEITRLQAQLAELSEADAIIKEWSDYADGLVADKTRLEQQVQELTQRQDSGSLSHDLRTADTERRIADWQRRAGEAERRATELERQVTALQQRAADAASRAEGLELQLREAERRVEDAESRASAPDSASIMATAAAASVAASPLGTPRQLVDTTEVLELRRQIARLEASLSALRMQLIETRSQPVSAREDAPLTARSQGDPSDRSTSQGVLKIAAGAHSVEDDAGNDATSRDGRSTGSGHDDRGWHEELEQLRARNASLEATVAGLQASLEVATLQAAQGSNSEISVREAKDQIQELQNRLSLVLQEKAELDSTVVLLWAELERAPLVSHESGVLVPADSAAEGASVSYQKAAAAVRTAAEDVVAAAASPDIVEDVAAAGLQQELEALEEEVEKLRRERSELRAQVKELLLELRRLEDAKEEAEHVASRLSSEMEELAEALDASNSENERLSLEVLTLRDQLEQLEGGQAAGSASGSRSQRSSEKSCGSGSDSDDSALLQRASLRQVDAERRELTAVRAAARDLIRQVVAGGQNQGGTEEDHDPSSGLSDGEDLAHALQSLRAQIAELQRQNRTLQQATPRRSSLNAASAAATVAAEAQLAEATARIDELQALLEDAEIENQHLTEQLEECLTGGRKGPDSVGSAAEECQSSYGGSAAAGATGASNPYSYGHANTLTLSAFEQRLAMVESQRDELSANLAESSLTNRRLEAEVAALQHELTAVRQQLDAGTSGALERTSLQVSTRGRASRAASDAEDKKRFDELQAANRKLEAVCHDLEEKAHVAQEQVQTLETELEAAKEKIRSLEAAAATLQKRMEDEAAGAGGRQSKEKVADLEARVSRLEREKRTLEEQLEEEWATRKQLEKSLKNMLDRAGDDEAAETVAAFEVKYNRLKERYKMLEESSQEELDELQDQLTEALSQVGDLQRQVKQLQSQAAQTRSAGAAGGAANVEELRNLRSENERLVQQLVSKTMELAELSESEITIKRELMRLQEVNRKLAQKATTLEAQAAVAQAGKPVKGKK
ncbi:hypothetical protein VaNZ11_005030 [Volvox africanus]|uniref:C2 NT-type domain-containing protein n=1 Tax=Volvox africanus TaxID=51714 RepID=A0ABQ5RXV9_9CHLO|nr:hypothetical protein VaNZ11_005030 [Volvox africanus]